MHADSSDIDENTFITFKTTETKCDEMYHEGVQLKANGYAQEALKCFLDCAKQMQDTHYLKIFPQTLHEIAALYRSLQLHDKAAEFVKAELLFYQTLLTEPQYEEACCSSTVVTENKEALVQRAEECERMAQLSRSHNKHKSALDYCGRAVKLRQAVFGTESELTLRTIEYFAVLYSESEGPVCVEMKGEENKTLLPSKTLTSCSEGVRSVQSCAECTKQLTIEKQDEHSTGVVNMYYRPFNLAPLWLIFIAIVLQVLVVLYVL